MTTAELSTAFFLQMLAIVAACRAMGWFTKRYLGQPSVVGEIVAGVILGPSLFGLLAPDLQAAIFPKDARGALYVVAQLGAGLFMFIVGLGFRPEHFRNNARSAAAVSLSGMLAPFLAAVALTPWLLQTPGLFLPGVTQVQATLFLGACIAITAFPVLARIIHDRGLDGTKLGALALSAGAIDDAGAWSVLAIVLASFGDGAGVAVMAIAGGAAFVIFAVFVGPRLFAPLGRIAEREGRINSNVLGTTMMLFLAAAFAMDWVGLHAVFGGFVLGAVMPRGFFAEEMKRKLEPFTLIVLLPAFFAYFGAQYPADGGRQSRPRDDDAGDPRRLDPRQGRRLLGGGAADRAGQRHRARHRRADERARADGADHHQHRATARHHRAGALLDAGGDDDRHHADGIAPVRAGLWPQGAPARRAGRAQRRRGRHAARRAGAGGEIAGANPRAARRSTSRCGGRAVRARACRAANCRAR